jgi:anti-sigma factor RsiW
MTTCIDLDPLLAERASGELDPADAVRLDAHLATCDRCRAELAAYQQALGLARLPALSDAERQALVRLPAVVRADLQRAPIGKALGRILTLAAVAAAIVVVVANKVVLPAARRSAEPAQVAATWKSPDPDALVERVVKEHAELAIASDEELSRAEAIADAAYQRAIAEGE